MDTGERQQGKEAGTLQCRREAALVLRAHTRLAAGLDLGAVRKEAAQARGVLIVDDARLVDAEGADLATRTEIAPATTTTFTAAAFATRGAVAARGGTGLAKLARRRSRVRRKVWCDVLFRFRHD